MIIHITRNDEALGQYDEEQVLEAYCNGTLLESDMAVVEGLEEPVPLSSLITIDKVQVTRDGEPVGEFEILAAKDALAQGTLLANDWGWMQGLETWMPLDILIEQYFKSKNIPIGESSPSPETNVDAETPAEAEPAPEIATEEPSHIKTEEKTEDSKNEKPFQKTTILQYDPKKLITVKPQNKIEENDWKTKPATQEQLDFLKNHEINIEGDLQQEKAFQLVVAAVKPESKDALQKLFPEAHVSIDIDPPLPHPDVPSDPPWKKVVLWVSFMFIGLAILGAVIFWMLKR